MGYNLLRLSRLTDDLEYQDRYDKIIEAFGGRINKGPNHFAYLLRSLMLRETGTKDLIIVVSGKVELAETLKEYEKEHGIFYLADYR
jgi:uncharacterized protein YyaL (SSP411 family)|nr:hypothetical protein [Vallitaleaceae bacterium]